MSAARSNPSPCPRVAFAPDFLARVERFSARFAAARGRSREFGARLGRAGGHDFVGYRPYHRHDDPRSIDWNAYARLDRALVKITRRDAGERVQVELDASASMGAGPPGKLQRAAEVTVAIAALALRERSETRVVIAAGSEGGGVLDVDRAPRLRDLLRVLESTAASGDDARPPATPAARDRRIVISDFSGRAPHEFGARGETQLVRILAPHELGLAADGPIEWVDPERGARLQLEIDGATRTRYTRELEAELERWRAALAPWPHVRHSVHSSASDFEDIVRRSFAR
jgi:uncharacterized protein (DUF58 family)